MSAVASLAPGARGQSASASIPMTRLVGVELRKMVDTRVGRWLLIGIGAVMVVLLGVVLATGSPADRAFTDLVAYAQLPLFTLLPVLGVLAATSEWSQRSVLSTFSLVPSRGRVLTAKVLSAVVLATVAAVFSLVAAAIAALIAPAVGTTATDWSIGISNVGEVVVFQVLSMLLGVALGTLLLSSAFAIVLYFVLPTLWGALTDSFASLHDAQRWLDTNSTWVGLVDPDAAMTSTAWAQVGATALLWVVLPLSLGLVRVLRREVD